MANDFLKMPNAELMDHIEDYDQNIGTVVKALGLNPIEMEEAKTVCKTMISINNRLEDVRLQVKMLTEERNLEFRNGKKFFREQAKRIKSARGYQESYGELLGINTNSSTIDYDDHKPVIKVIKMADGIRIEFNKKGTDGVNIYRRAENSNDWTFINRDNRSPYLDNSHLNGHNEYEYRVRAVIDDIEVGHFSDVVLVTV